MSALGRYILSGMLFVSAAIMAHGAAGAERANQGAYMVGFAIGIAGAIWALRFAMKAENQNLKED